LRSASGPSRPAHSLLGTSARGTDVSVEPPWLEGQS
jgi:hypothetical protein